MQPTLAKGRSRDEHRFPDRKDHLCCVLVDGQFQPLREPQLHERVREGGTPSPKLAVAGTGMILLLGGLSMLLGVYPVVGIILLIVFLLGVSFQMHTYWKLDDAQMKQIDMINFTKNMALVGALLMFLLLPHPWPMSLGIG
jgi:putative oxidoreductase